MTITPDLVADVKMIVIVMVVEVLEGGILVSSTTKSTRRL